MSPRVVLGVPFACSRRFVLLARLGCSAATGHGLFGLLQGGEHGEDSIHMGGRQQSPNAPHKTNQHQAPPSTHAGDVSVYKKAYRSGVDVRHIGEI